MVIVSAADEKYFTGLANLVGSVHYWSPKSLVVIYDLGLSNQQKREILTWRSAHLIHDIPGNEVPLHCHQLKLYAWKPVILAHAVEHYDSILWVDAAYQTHLAWKTKGYSQQFKQLVDISSIEPLTRMFVKLAHRCGRECRCGGRMEWSKVCP